MSNRPLFEEAVLHITDPSYRIGVSFIQLPLNWPGTETARVHDLRYDYLDPGEDTTAIDIEARNGWIKEGCSELQITAFFKIIRLWGRLFQEGEHVCRALGKHDWVPCSYGQMGMIYDMRCSVCGLHIDLENFNLTKETI